MSTLLHIIFFIVIFLILLIILTAVTPYYYFLKLSYKKKMYYQFNLSFLFIDIFLIKNKAQNFLIIKVFRFKKRLNLSLLAENNKKKINKSLTKVKNTGSEKIKNIFFSKENNKNKSLINFKRNLKIFNRDNLKHLFNFLIQLFSDLKADKFRLDLLFSAADPYYNGLFLAFYYSAKEILDLKNFKAEICWEEIKLEAELEISGRIILAELFLDFLRFVFSFKTLKILKEIYQYNKKG